MTNVNRGARVCIVYDCLFPYTVGGAERWYRNLSEQLARSGHEVTYVTRPQWDIGAEPRLEGVTIKAVGPRMKLYTKDGRRSIVQAVIFGAAVFLHLVWARRRYDVVHTASFPYFSLLAAAAVRPLGGYRIVVDWHEVWSLSYWNEYLGARLGRVGHFVQRLCIRVPQQAFCFSDLYAARLAAGGLRGTATVLRGEYAGRTDAPVRSVREPVVVFAGRHIPEKQVASIPPALSLARRSLPTLRAEIYGDGPEREAVRAAVAKAGLEDVITMPGFVDATRLEEAIAGAMCLILPSRREGYGLVVVEAASRGTPSVLVAAPDNAAVELISHGENGYIAQSSTPESLAAAILQVHSGGRELRDSTHAWFQREIPRLAIDASISAVVASYARR